MNLKRRNKVSQSLNELIKQIEELRLELIRAKNGRTYTDPEVIAASQALDEVLDKYQELLDKNSKM